MRIGAFFTHEVEFGTNDRITAQPTVTQFKHTLLSMFFMLLISNRKNHLELNTLTGFIDHMNRSI